MLRREVNILLEKVNWAELVDQDESESDSNESEKEDKKTEAKENKQKETKPGEEPLINMQTIYEKNKEGEYVIKGLQIFDKKQKVIYIIRKMKKMTVTKKIAKTSNQQSKKRKSPTKKKRSPLKKKY